MERLNLFRALALVTLIAAVIAALVARDPVPGTPLQGPSVARSDNLIEELRACAGLGQADADDPHCRDVWAESRRRFFGKPAKPFPSPNNPVPPAGGAK